MRKTISAIIATSIQTTSGFTIITIPDISKKAIAIISFKISLLSTSRKFLFASYKYFTFFHASPQQKNLLSASDLSAAQNRNANISAFPMSFAQKTGTNWSPLKLILFSFLSCFSNSFFLYIRWSLFISCKFVRICTASLCHRT